VRPPPEAAYFNCRCAPSKQTLAAE
jgi:hypothetical protein